MYTRPSHQTAYINNQTAYICMRAGQIGYARWTGAGIIDQLDPSSAVRACTTDPRPIVWTLVSCVCHRSDSLFTFLL